MAVTAEMIERAAGTVLDEVGPVTEEQAAGVLALMGPLGSRTEFTAESLSA